MKFGTSLKKSDICCYLEESCGYGEPLDKTSCCYCDGKCIRPSIKAKPIALDVESGGIYYED